ncbi:MAG: TonB-dependent receptor [Bacteroidia bacterium]|nr:TonB-dependent receptor [Bacteroidia bacterium]
MKALFFTILLLISYSGYCQEIGLLQDTITDKAQFTFDEIVITAPYADQTRSSSTLSVSSVNLSSPENQNQSISSILENLPGVFVDGSIGEVQSRVHTRGVSIAAEDDIGWYYTSIFEDGLPLTLTQHTFYSPDLFIRNSNSLSKAEFIRGGQAAVLGINSPGSILNLISSDTYEQSDLSLGLRTSGTERNGFDFDLNLNGDLDYKGQIQYHLGFLYQKDQGFRKTDFNWRDGGQIKAKIHKKFKNSEFTIHVKFLDDNTNRYLGLPATNWSDPQAASDFDFTSTALMPSTIITSLPDGRTFGQKTISYDSNDGIKVTDLSTQIDYGWQPDSTTQVQIKTKYSRKTSNWNSIIGNQILGLENFLPYFLTGLENPWGQVEFIPRDDPNGLVAVDNSGALAIFSGGTPSFHYTGPNQLPNNALLGSAIWLKDDQASEWMTELSFQKKLKRHELVASIFTGFSKVDMYTTASYVFASYEANPKALSVILNNPPQPIRLSDGYGVSNYNGLFYEDGTSNNFIGKFSLWDRWKLSSKLRLYLGLKLENISYNGQRYLPEQLGQSGGWDSRLQTGYDNAVLVRGQPELFKDTYATLNYSAGVNFNVSSGTSLFANYSSGKKAPELDYYFNTFTGVPIKGKGEIQKINQAELGINIIQNSIAGSVSAFYSQLKDFGSTDFAFDPMSGQIFYTPLQNNQVKTWGLEFESRIQVFRNLSFISTGTIQSSKTVDYTIYDANGSVAIDDDEIINYSGNKIPHTPSVMLRVTPEYSLGNLRFNASLSYMGPRYGNAENSFEMAGYFTLGAHLNYQLGRLIFSLTAKNITNSDGLLNFFGPDEFGSSANQATSDYIRNNPDGRFVVFPILPRSVHLGLRYQF